MLARRYGFPSWPKLVRHLEVADRFRGAPHEAPPATGLDETRRLGVPAAGLPQLRRRRSGAPRPGADLLAAHPSLPRAVDPCGRGGGRPRCGHRADRDRPVGRPPAGGPHVWEPPALPDLQPGPGRAAGVTTRRARATAAGPRRRLNAGYLWEGLVPPFTALTGVFGGGEDDPNQPPHPTRGARDRLLEAAPTRTTARRSTTGASRPTTPLRILFAHGLGEGDGGPWRPGSRAGSTTPREMLEDLLLPAASIGFHDPCRAAARPRRRSGRRGNRHPAAATAARSGTRIHAGAARSPSCCARPARRNPARRRRGAACGLHARRRGRARAAGRRGRSGARGGRPRRATRADPDGAADLGRTDAVRLLAGIGLDVNARRPGPRRRSTAPPTTATANVAESLIELGADPTRRDGTFHATPAGGPSTPGMPSWRSGWRSASWRVPDRRQASSARARSRTASGTSR